MLYASQTSEKKISFEKFYSMIRSASGGTHYLLQSGLATTLPDLSLEYLSTNIKSEPIICYDPLCKPLGPKLKSRPVK